ncbi:conserved hypothetical protein [Candidatus Nitrotoga sp. 1052]|nr:conserved hypothetical protein [Candidatus Nitrotoga sp. 1052]
MGFFYSVVRLHVTLRFTLDTNCVVALDEGRPEGPAVRALADAHRTGRAHVAVCAIMASEKQRSGGHLESFDQFTDRLVRLGLDHLVLTLPMMYWDISFWNRCADGDEDEMENLERRIHEILFPGLEFLYKDHCLANGIDPEAIPPDRKWRNPKCDIQAFWSHAHARRNVFVSSDGNFHAQTKRTRLIALAGGHIETPQSALSLLESNAA